MIVLIAAIIPARRADKNQRGRSGALRMTNDQNDEWTNSDDQESWNTGSPLVIGIWSLVICHL